MVVQFNRTQQQRPKNDPTLENKHLFCRARGLKRETADIKGHGAFLCSLNLHFVQFLLLPMEIRPKTKNGSFR